MKATQCFVYSFNGINDLGEIGKMGTTYAIDFPVEQPTGYGFAFRNKIDYSFDQSGGLSEFEFEVKASQALTAKIEFKTQNSGGAAETEHIIEIPEGEYQFSVEVNIKNLSSPLTEVCLFIPKHKNKELTKTDFAVLSYEQK